MTNDIEKLHEELHKKAVNRFNELHSSIFGSISAMLIQAKLQPMTSLRSKDPSFSALVDELSFYRDVAERIGALLAINCDRELELIDEYLELAREMANAIDVEDYDALCGAIAALNDKPYV